MKILIVDDELVVCESCAKVMKRKGHEVKYSTSGREALKIIESERFDIVFSDLKMIDLGGMEVLKFIRQNCPNIVVVIITGYATIASAVETMKLGAFDYLPKPFTANELSAVLNKAVEKRNQLISEEEIKHPGDIREDYSGIIGKSEKMQEVYRLIDKVAQSESTVLIMGGSGTGKELVARAIHEKSARKSNAFIAVDCGTLGGNLLASDLFGYVKGAFTGADKNKKGIFEMADGGTIFLDEIGNIDMQVQTTLLRVLQEHSFIPIGGTEAKKVDVRMIFATNSDLQKLVMKEKFREDLYYRLYVFPIRMPDLCERKDDIPKLSYHFLKKYNKRDKKKIQKISDDVMKIFMENDWPGNVRQLENTVERMMILAEGDALEVKHLPSTVNYSDKKDFEIPRDSEELKIKKKEIREQSVEQIEKSFILDALKRNEWNVSRSAKNVKMQRSNFQALMRKYSIQGDDLEE